MMNVENKCIELMNCDKIQNTKYINFLHGGKYFYETEFFHWTLLFIQ